MKSSVLPFKNVKEILGQKQECDIIKGNIHSIMIKENFICCIQGYSPNGFKHSFVSLKYI